MLDFHIRRCTRQCHVSGEQFHPGDVFFSVLVSEGAEVLPNPIGTAPAIIDSPQRNRIQRSTFRYTNLSPDQVSSTAQTLMSTRP